jgi:hypothetical protein
MDGSPEQPCLEPALCLSVRQLPKAPFGLMRQVLHEVVARAERAWRSTHATLGSGAGSKGLLVMAHTAAIGSCFPCPRLPAVRLKCRHALALDACHRDSLDELLLPDEEKHYDRHRGH